MQLTALLLPFTYPALFISAFIEGPVTMMGVGFLLKLGHFSLVPAYFSMLLGDLTGDLFWYGLGYHGAHRFIRKFGKFFSITEESTEKISSVFRRHGGKILFVSKITMGLGFSLGTLFAAGMSKVPLKKFLILNFFGGLMWTAWLMFVGYAFGDFYLRVSEIFRLSFLIFFAMIIFLGLNGLGKYLRGYFTKKL